jgi:hypothetical protein
VTTDSASRLIGVDQLLASRQDLTSEALDGLEASQIVVGRRDGSSQVKDIGRPSVGRSGRKLRLFDFAKLTK